MLERLLPAPAEPAFLTAAEMTTLRAICARLLPQPDRPAAEQIDVAAIIDQRLAAGDSDGWRYDALPADADAYRAGLAWLDAAAQAAGTTSFAEASANQQDSILHTAGLAAVAQGGFEISRWFEELLAEAAEAYYAHPVAQEEIGYVGMADVPGWTRIGLNELEPREPME